MTYAPPMGSIQVRRGGPNDALLFRRWQALNNTSRCVMNALDVSSIVPVDSTGTIQSGDALVQATGAKQALLNVTDSDFGNKPTIEFADAEVYRTAGNVSLPSPMTMVHVAQDLNAGSFSSLFESDTYYSVSNGGFIFYCSGTRTLFAGWNYGGVTDKVLTLPSTVPFVAVVSIDPSAAGASAFPTARANGSAFSNNLTSSTSGSFRAQRLQLGGREVLASQYWNGPWACTSIYSGTFTTQQAADELAYWKAEYSI